jgi:hypothetical protein
MMYPYLATNTGTRQLIRRMLRAKPIIHALISVVLLLLLCLSSLVRKRCHHGEVVHDTPRVLTRQTSTLRITFAIGVAAVGAVVYV